jgi:hypothetical protein
VSALATKPSAAQFDFGRPSEPVRAAKPPFEPKRPTLEDTILGAWEDLVLDGRAQCPVCSGELVLAGGCTSCGSELS